MAWNAYDDYKSTKILQRVLIFIYHVRICSKESLEIAKSCLGFNVL